MTATISANGANIGDKATSQRVFIS